MYLNLWPPSYPDQKQTEGEKDPEIDFKIKADDEEDELAGIIKRRGPNPNNYQLHFDDIDNDSNGNETILARAPEVAGSLLGTDSNLNTEFTLTDSDGVTNSGVPSSESTFGNAALELNDDRGETFTSPKRQSAREPGAQNTRKGVKFDMDVSEQSVDGTKDYDDEDTTGSLGISTLHGDDGFNTMSTSKCWLKIMSRF